MRYLLILLLVGCSPIHYSEHGSGKAVFVLSTAEGINDPSMTPLRDQLVAAGFKVVAVDFPCHGKETGGLECWRERYQRGETFDAYLADLRALMDRKGTIGVIGVSRAGFLTLLIAGSYPHDIPYALISPVVDLMDLAEFRGAKGSGISDARALAPALQGKRIYLAIGKNDDRVNTYSSIELATLVPSVQLVLTDTEGHGHPDIDPQVVEWIKQR